MADKLLIIDDDELIRLIIKETLEQTGYYVEIAEDGLTGWNKINTNPSGFDLVLLDRRMPNLDGLALLKRIRADQRFKELPVILLTADTKPEEILEGLAEGAYYYLTKPTSEEVLKLVIKNALNDYNQLRTLRSLVNNQTKYLQILDRAEFSIRTLTEAKELAIWLADATLAPSRTVNGFSELLINAVEHGNLGIGYAEKSQLLINGLWLKEIESRLQDPRYANLQVKVCLEKTTSAFITTIKDQGNGFDWPKFLEFNPDRIFDLHGRGIAMAKAMSFDNMEYLGNGNTVIATINIAKP